MYFNEDNWELFKGHGMFGIFVHQAENGMIQFPKIYLLELYQFNSKDKARFDTIIVAWRYNTEGILTNEVSLTKKENMCWTQVRKEIRDNGYITLSNGDTVYHENVTSYDEVKKIVDEETERIKSQLN